VREPLRRRAGNVLPRILWGILVAGLLAVASLAIVSRTDRLPPLERLGTVPPFHLLDQQGNPFTASDMEGKVWVADFIFTRCRGTCPILTRRMQELAASLEEGDDWSLLSITVDPAFDTPPVLAAYAEEHASPGRRWVLLTGEREQVRELITKGFFLAAEEGAGSDAEPILHSTRFVLVDRKGGIRGYYEAMDEADGVRLRRDVERLRKAG
jgi:protein SCO1/2